MKKGNYAKIIVLAISLFAVFFMGYYVSTLQNNKNASEEKKSMRFFFAMILQKLLYKGTRKNF